MPRLIFSAIHALAVRFEFGSSIATVVSAAPAAPVGRPSAPSTAFVSLLCCSPAACMYSPCDLDVYYSGGRGRRVYRTDFRTGESSLVCMTDSEVLDIELELGECC